MSTKSVKSSKKSRYLVANIPLHPGGNGGKSVNYVAMQLQAGPFTAAASQRQRPGGETLGLEQLGRCVNISETGQDQVSTSRNVHEKVSLKRQCKRIITKERTEIIHCALSQSL